MRTAGRITRPRNGPRDSIVAAGRGERKGPSSAPASVRVQAPAKSSWRRSAGCSEGAPGARNQSQHRALHFKKACQQSGGGGRWEEEQGMAAEGRGLRLSRGSQAPAGACRPNSQHNARAPTSPSRSPGTTSAGGRAPSPGGGGASNAPGGWDGAAVQSALPVRAPTMRTAAHHMGDLRNIAIGVDVRVRAVHDLRQAARGGNTLAMR